MSKFCIAFSLLAAGLMAGCVHVDPIEVKPIHITLDINIRVDQQLDDFFAFEQKYKTPTTAPATLPTASINSAE